MSTPQDQLFNPDPSMMQFGDSVGTNVQLDDPTASSVMGIGSAPSIGSIGSTPSSVGSTTSPVSPGGYTTPSGPSTWQQVLSGLTGGQSGASFLGQALPYGLAAGVGLLQAKGAQNQATSEVNQLLSATQPFLNASQQFLKQFESQTLTPAQKQYVDWTSAEAQDLVNSGNAAKAIATTNFADYQAGTLKPADQTALDQQVSA